MKVKTKILSNSIFNVLITLIFFLFFYLRLADNFYVHTNFIFELSSPSFPSLS